MQLDSVGQYHRAKQVPNGFIIALTYSSQSEWVKNVLAAGGYELRTRGKRYLLSSPHVVHNSTRERFPFPVRLVRPFKNVLIDQFEETRPELAQKLRWLSGQQFERLYNQAVGREW